MSTKLLLFFLAVCAIQLTSVVNGDRRIPAYGLDTGRHVAEQLDEYQEFIREKRAASTANPSGATNPKPKKLKTTTTPNPLSKKRVAGFVAFFSLLTGLLFGLALCNVGLFIWLSITLKKVRKN